MVSSYTYFRKARCKTSASCFTAWKSVISSKKNAIAQCCAINIALVDSKHQLHSLFDIVFSKKAWVSSKRCGNRKVGVPPASSARLAKISVAQSVNAFMQKNWPFFDTPCRETVICAICSGADKILSASNQLFAPIDVGDNVSLSIPSVDRSACNMTNLLAIHCSCKDARRILST